MLIQVVAVGLLCAYSYSLNGIDLEHAPLEVIAACRDELRNSVVPQIESCIEASNTAPAENSAESLDQAFDKFLDDLVREEAGFAVQNDSVLEEFADEELPQAGFLTRLRMFAEQASIIGYLISAECWSQVVVEKYGVAHKELTTREKMFLLPKFSYMLAKMATTISTTSITMAWLGFKEEFFGDSQRQLTVKEKAILCAAIAKRAAVASAVSAASLTCTTVQGACAVAKDSTKKVINTGHSTVSCAAKKVMAGLNCLMHLVLTHEQGQ